MKKLTTAQKIALLEEKASGSSNKELASKYGLSPAYVSVLVARNRTKSESPSPEPVSSSDTAGVPSSLKQINRLILEIEQRGLNEAARLYKAAAKKLQEGLTKKQYAVKSISWEPFVPKTDYEAKNPSAVKNRYEVVLILTQAQIVALPSLKGL